jgi:WD repeat-containing protein 7
LTVNIASKFVAWSDISPDALTLIYVNPKGILVTQPVKLSPRGPPVVQDASNQDSNLAHHSSLPLPNPFKGIMSRSAEHIPIVESQPDPGKSEPSEYEMGEILSQGDPLGLRTRAVGNRLRGIAWSDKELAVRSPE